MYRVLIIDDEPWSRQVIRALGNWESLNIEIAGEAEDGSMGLAMIQSLSPDLVITDMRMPGLDGVELLKAINEQFPSLSIIVISGYDDFIYLRQAVLSRAADYLLKPLDEDELNAALAKCVGELSKKRAAEPQIQPATAIFNEAEQRDAYLALRKQLRAGLLELNQPGVEEALGKIEQSMIEKIGQDLIFMIEQFAAENGIELISVWQRHGRSFDGTAEALNFIYGEVLQEARAFRQGRSRLDMADVVQFIDRYFQEFISLDTVARYFFVTKEHLSRSFKAYTGQNMTDYIIQAKMNKAKQMIEGGVPIKRAAEAVGYTDLAYFYRLFKKQYGFNPGDLYKLN